MRSGFEALKIVLEVAGIIIGIIGIVQGLHQLDVVEVDPWGEFRAAISNDNGPGVPNGDPFDDDPPEPPANLQITQAAGGCELTFTWEPSPSEDVRNYKLYRDGTFAGFAEGTSKSLRQFNSEGETYFVVASDGFNESAHSNDVQAAACDPFSQ